MVVMGIVIVRGNEDRCKEDKGNREASEEKDIRVGNIMLEQGKSRTPYKLV